MTDKLTRIADEVKAIVELWGEACCVRECTHEGCLIIKRCAAYLEEHILAILNESEPAVARTTEADGAEKMLNVFMEEFSKHDSTLAGVANAYRAMKDFLAALRGAAAQPTPAEQPTLDFTEFIRKDMMRRFHQTLSMEDIASFSHYLAKEFQAALRGAEGSKG